MSTPIPIALTIATLCFIAPSCGPEATAVQRSGVRFELSFPESASAEPIDGRLLLGLATAGGDSRSMQTFGVTVDGLEPAETIVFDESRFPALRGIDRGEYRIEALLRRGDQTDEGGLDQREQGDLLSSPATLLLDPARGSTIAILLDHTYRTGPRFAISFPEEVAPRPLNGRIVLTVSDAARELSPDTPAAAPKRRTFVVDVRDLDAGEKVEIDSSTFEELAGLGRGDYTVEALLHLDRVGADDAEVARAPGDLYSLPATMTFEPAAVGTPFAISLDRSVARGPTFRVSFPKDLSAEPLDGRMLLMVSGSDEAEPRFRVSDSPSTAQVFGVDVNDLEPGAPAVIDGKAVGYPLASLADLPPGEYTVQALLHRYETFHRMDGHVVKLPMDRGEGQQWNRAPGNLYSEPRQIYLDPTNGDVVEISLDKQIPPIPPADDTAYIKHITIRSALLSQFWGRPMELGAVVLLPHGFDEHPDARYPLIVNHGHFPHTFTGFRETPPDPDLEPDYSERFRLAGYNRIQQEQAYEFYKTWTSPDFPRFVIIKIQHANPYYDDSYAVNSQNLGPYGDAIMRELIPHVEERFRCIGEGWARFTYGGSTGGWEALAVQVLYPDEFNGCFAACPDPIDFRAYTVVDIYEDENAYEVRGEFKRVPRPGHRDWLGHVSGTLAQMNQRELALGTKSRSGQQWDIWEAVYSPVGADGYPKRIWDKVTGEIDHDVAAFWRENYDLRYILARDWKTLGPKLAGKIHIYCGTMDNYYLNNAVYLMEEFLESTEDPHYDGVVDYGDRAEHCWNGDHERPNAVSRLRYHVMYVDEMLARMAKTAPEGGDLTSWRY